MRYSSTIILIAFCKLQSLHFKCSAVAFLVGLDTFQIFEWVTSLYSSVAKRINLPFQTFHSLISSFISQWSEGEFSFRLGSHIYCTSQHNRPHPFVIMPDLPVIESVDTLQTLEGSHTVYRPTDKLLNFVTAHNGVQY